jgi:hypothetical protein
LPEQNLARNVQEATTSNFPKPWTVETDTSPEIDTGENGDGDREYGATLSRKA